MELTDEEKATLKRLNNKVKEPDPAPVGKSIHANVDLSNPESVSLAQKFGFLPADEKPADDGDGDGDGDTDDKPKRRGYFGDS